MLSKFGWSSIQILVCVYSHHEREYNIKWERICYDLPIITRSIKWIDIAVYRYVSVPSVTKTFRTAKKHLLFSVRLFKKSLFLYCNITRWLTFQEQDTPYEYFMTGPPKWACANLRRRRCKRWISSRAHNKLFSVISFLLNLFLQQCLWVDYGVL